MITIHLPTRPVLTPEQIVCRDIWALHLSLLPEPPPAEPLPGAQPAAEVQASKQDTPAREGSPDAGASGDEAGNEGGSSSSSSDDDDEDPEIAELMRQAEESPSSSEDEDEQEEGAKKVPAHRKRKSRFGRKYDMPVNNLAVIVVACWTLRLPVAYMDFIRHVNRCITVAHQLTEVS